MKKASTRLRLALALWILLAISPTTVAGPLVRPAGAPMPGSSAAAAAAARAAQVSAAAARQANDKLQQALSSVQRFLAQQNAARLSAAAAASAVPNGLTTGGLVIDPAATSSPESWNGARPPTESANGSRMDVEIVQTQPKAILSWQSFNVGRETDVHFDQRAAGASATDWIALNRVSDPSGKPSQILGSIRAEGQIYLINPNGVVFGGTSQVNVSSLIASSLDFAGNTLQDRNAHFRNGILYNPNESVVPALVFSDNGNANSSGVAIEAGAQITAAGGRAMFLGHNVSNAGMIQATDGEVVLAAGGDILLNKNYGRGRNPSTAPDPNLRGLTVGVNRGGLVENTGMVLSDRGSINIQAKSILQSGLLQATTSDTANGYINLTAGDGITLVDPSGLSPDGRRPYPDPLLGGTFGDLTFAEGSITQILPDPASKPVIGFDQFRPSMIEMFGRYVTFANDSTFFAPGATVTIDGLRGNGVHDSNPDDARIYVGQGARIDLSGLRGIEVPMERNTIAAEVRANELADNPLLRGSFLQGQTVYFDARKGTNLLDVSGYYDLIARSVPELMTAGGTIQLNAPQIITREGSTIDLSGGSLSYLNGYVKSTFLVDQFGQVVPIEQADPTMLYVGLAGGQMVSHPSWGVTESYSSALRGRQGTYEQGYVEGRSAGVLTIGQPSSYDFTPTAYGYRILDGNVVADVVVGPNQRQPPSGATAKDVTQIWQERPSGATLNFGYLNLIQGNGTNQPVGGNITIDSAPLLPDNFAFNSSIDPSAEYNHVLPARCFDGKTFSVVNLYSGSVGSDASAPGGRLTIGPGITMDLGDYGKFNFQGTRADIEGTIRARGGTVNVVAARVASPPRDPNDPNWNSQPDWRVLDDASKPQINLGPNAVIDVAGRWVNQLLNEADRPELSIRGGSVTLVTSNNLSLAAGSLIDVSGGARLSSDGHTVTAGSAGSISLINAYPVEGARFAPSGPSDGSMRIDGTLRGYGLSAGGSLAIATGKSVLIADRPSVDPGTLTLSPDFFRQGGFANFVVAGSSGLTVAQNTVIAPQVVSYVLDNSSRSLPTGASLFESARPTVYTGDLAKPMSVTLSGPAVDSSGNPLKVGVGDFNWTPTFGQSPGQVQLETGAQIQMSPGSTVRLVSASNVFVDGTISAPGGLIDLRTGVDQRTNGTGVPAVRLGPNARLLAPGYVKTLPQFTAEGLLSRHTVEGGGRVTFGQIPLGPAIGPPDTDFVGFVVSDPGSVIDVSGVRGPASLTLMGSKMTRPITRYVDELVDGNAGSVVVATQGGGVLAGQLRLASGGPTGRGGSLEIDAPDITVTQSVSANLGPVTSSSNIDRGVGLTVVADPINASGVDDLALKPTGILATRPPRAVVFDGDVTLSSRRSIAMGGPVIAAKPGSAGTVRLSSQYVAFNPLNSALDPTISASPMATDLGGSFMVTANLIDIGYGVDFGCASANCVSAGVNVGFKDVHFVSSGDIRLQPQGLGNGLARITAGGTLSFDAAQVYVTSALNARTPYIGPSSDPGFLIQAGTAVSIHGNGAPAPIPYSFGERLTIRAPTVTQGGILRAPLGEIHLEGTQGVSLEPGSLTSTSLEGQQVLWSLANTDPAIPFPSLTQNGGLGTLPTKSVQLQAPNVAVATGATIDVSGGGDVATWQFIAGTGGTKNILHGTGVFSIVPSYDGAVPADWQALNPQSGFYASSVPRVGQKVYLQGVPGLPAGTYTLLPGDYAQLNGGFLIQPVAAGLAQAPDSTLRPDGSSLVGGYFLVGGTSIRDPGYSRFLVMPQNVFGKYSSFTPYSFNDFVAAVAQSNGVVARAGIDAGSVVLGATSSLVLNGNGRFSAAVGGLLGNLDISSQKIAVTGGGTAAPTGYLEVDAHSLSRFGAGSVLIGGTRSFGAGGTNVTVNATDVVVNNDASSALTGPEILIGAQKTLSVTKGSIIVSQGSLPGDVNPLILSGDGAFLRVSTGDRVNVVRANAPGSTGVLNVGAGAVLQSRGGLTLDASRSLVLDETAVFLARQLDLRSSKVSMGNVPNSATGTVLSKATLANLANTKDLLIRGSQSIDLYGTFTLGGRDSSGNPTLGTLTLDTSLLNGVLAPGDAVSIVAGQITLSNSGSAAAVPAVVAGNLVLQTSKLILGPGTLGVGGFSNINAIANTILASGSGALNFDGSMSLSTDLLTAAVGSDYSVGVSGDLSVVRVGSPPGTADDFGGHLALIGSSLHLDTTVDMPSGIFEARATAGDLTLGSSAVLRTQGQVVDFRDAMRAASGGTIRLTASRNVTAASGSELDVSGNPRGGSAGSIEVSAGGVATIDSALKAAAAVGDQGGAFSLHAGSLSNFGALNAALEAGAMTGSRAVHVATGDLVLGAGQNLTAHQVLLSTDNGAVVIDGTINAAGDSAYPSGGSIRLIGGNGISLASSARLIASAKAAKPNAFLPDSGRVEIAATGGWLEIARGAVVDVSGGKQGGGLVLLRALRDGDDIAVEHLDGVFAGAREMGLVGMRSYQTQEVDAALRDGMLSDAADWMANSSAIEARLGTSAFEVRPGILVQSAGNLAVGADINLSGARYGAGAPGYLELSAAGDLNIHANISDGFDSSSRTASLNSGRSWTYALEAGGDINLGAGKLIRTGTGSIRVDAGRDLVFEDNLSSVYTAGTKTATAPGFIPIAGTGDFPTQGGDIQLAAGRDILAPVTKEAASAWLFRYGDTAWTDDPMTSTVAQQTSWSIVFANFQQAVGALGGGNIAISAGRDVSQLSVSLPTTGHITTALGNVPKEGDIQIRGGGNLTLRAGRDLKGGVFLLSQGAGQIDVGGRLTYGDTLVAQRTTLEEVPNPSPNHYNYQMMTLAALFGLADATLNVHARTGAEIEAAFDPMLQGQVCQNSGCDFDHGVVSNVKAGSAFFGMTNRTAMSVTSMSGKVQYDANPWASVDLSHGTPLEAVMFIAPGAAGEFPTTTESFARAPGTLQLASLHDDVVIANKRVGGTSLTLAPSDNGTIDLLAQNGLYGQGLTSSRAFTVSMLDVGDSYRRGAADAFLVTSDTVMNLRVAQPSATTNGDRGFVPAHVSDETPARLYSMTQSIPAGTGAVLPKSLSVYSGKDLSVGAYVVQDNRPDDVSSFVAGRDAIDLNVLVTGVGDLVVSAGRNIRNTGGNTAGFISAGNQPNINVAASRNLALPTNQGANIYLYAGTASNSDYFSFTAAYLDPQNSSHLVRTYLGELESYMGGLGFTGLGDHELIAQFQGLPAQSREAFAQRILFTELKETGVDANDPKSPRYQDYTRGYAAIHRLFPKDTAQLSSTQRSNILLDAKLVETQAGGDITLLAPYGRVEIGGASVDPIAQKGGGTVTLKGGSIRIIADLNIDLFASRVFTLQGGDITMWTSNGDITAGVGAKTTLSRPPLIYIIDNDGTVRLNIFGLQTGAGIGVLDAGGTGARVASRLDLIAPHGEVNAGDAGIRAVGDLNIAALRVVGLDNIQATGTSTGVPKVSVPNVSALTSAGQTLAAAAETLGAAAQPKAKPEELPSIVTVEVIGYETQDDNHDGPSRAKKH